MDISFDEVVKLFVNSNFEYDNNTYCLNDFNNKTYTINLNSEYYGIINKLFYCTLDESVQGKSFKFILKVNFDILESYYYKNIILNNILAQHKLTPKYLSHQLVEYKDQVIFFYIQELVDSESNGINNPNLITGSADLLARLHKVDINKFDYIDIVKKYSSINIINLINKGLVDYKFIAEDYKLTKVISTKKYNKIISEFNLYLNNHVGPNKCKSDNRYLCFIDPINENFIINDEQYLVDTEYVSILDYTGIIWDITYYIVINELDEKQEGEFIKSYLAQNNIYSARLLQEHVDKYKKIVILFNIIWYRNIINKYILTKENYEICSRKMYYLLGLL